MHKNESRIPSNPNAVVPVMLSAKGLKVTSTGGIDPRYVDGNHQAMRSIQQWYRDQLLVNRTFRLDPLVQYVAKKTLSELMVDATNAAFIESTLQIIKEAREAGALNFCDPTRLFAISSVGFSGTGGLCIGRGPGQYGVISCQTPQVIRVALSMTDGGAAVISGLDPFTEGLPFSNSANITIGGMAHEMGHAFGGGTVNDGGPEGLRHPDTASHGYSVGTEGSSGTVTYGASTVNDAGKNWGANQWVGEPPYDDMEVQVFTGAPPYQWRQIVSNTPTQITVDSPWSPLPGPGTPYLVGRARSIMGTAFYDYPNAILYKGERDHLLNNFPDWFV